MAGKRLGSCVLFATSLEFVMARKCGPSSRSCSYAQRIVEIVPAAILLFDQIDLPLAFVLLQSAFALNSGIDVCEDFEIDELRHAIAFGESGCGAFAMFPYAPDEIVGHANIKRPVLFAGEDVNIVLLVHRQRHLDGPHLRAMTDRRLNRSKAKLTATS